MKYCLISIIILLNFWLLAGDVIVCSFEDWRPWLISKGNNNGEGILIDIFEQALEIIDYKLEIRILPYNRRNYYEWGKSIHAEPGCIPAWREKFADTSVYTIPLINTNNVILAKKGNFQTPHNKLHDFYNKRIGTNLGYFYTDGFSEAFEKELIIRDDSKEGTSILMKLNTNRVDCVIIDKYEADYWIKFLGLNRKDFEVVYRFSQISDLRIRLHKDKEYLIEPLNKAIKQITESSDFENIIKKYTE